MGHTVTIRGKYWRPLGTLDHVRQEFEKAFPSASFAVQPDPQLFATRADRIRAMSKIQVGGPLRLIVRLRLFLSVLGRSRYPNVQGQMQGEGYAVEFYLGSGPIVRKVHLVFYGRDWEVPGRLCDQLIARTGWVLKA
jgi:hypothetical protein